jgi:hypothetical protein
MLVCSFALSRVWFGPGENTILSKGAFRIIVLVFFFRNIVEHLRFRGQGVKVTTRFTDGCKRDQEI